MATLRCTAKYRKALHLPEKLPESVDNSLLGEWYANTLSIGHQQFLHYMSAMSLLSVIVPRRESRTAEQRMVEALELLLISFGSPAGPIAAQIESMQSIKHARASNRSVLASMRDQAFVARNAVYGRRASSCWEIMLDLSVMPCGALGYNNPRKVTLELLRESGAG
ncbi:MAG: hypothetical protein DMF58_13900 [Acidobacteria bacterium]|nr:MAG: hypothetical protein DMF58_13900 [Acidobacteriota bacterium]